MPDSDKHIIVGVLNWGLGHATRSVIVIKRLIEFGYQPVLASDGLALDYLQKEFPQLQHERLPSYNIEYQGKNFALGMLKRLPTIATSVRKERKLLKTLIKKHDALGVISDNRLGFYNKAVKSVYITHQVSIPFSFPFSLASSLHRFYIGKYDQCWLPDVEFPPLVSGGLAQTKGLHIPRKYLGPLSRFTQAKKESKKTIDLLVILSGPEPQRTRLETKILTELKEISGNHVLIRGTNNGSISAENVQVKNLVMGEELEELIRSSEMVVGRSGYSSLMDYSVLGNKALLIPTPGQVEQEFLSKFHQKEGNYFSVSQNELQLKRDIKEAKKYSGLRLELEEPDWKDLFGLFQSKGKS